MNTGSSIITFLMVFLIQNTQNRDAEAMHIKMDELIRAIEGAHNALLNLEDVLLAQLIPVRMQAPLVSRPGAANRGSPAERRLASSPVKVPALVLAATLLEMTSWRTTFCGIACTIRPNGGIRPPVPALRREPRAKEAPRPSLAIGELRLVPKL